MLETDRSLLKKWLWSLGILAAFIFIAWQLGKVAILILLSFLVAYFLNPLVTRLAQLRFMGRTSATIITLCTLTVGFITVMFFLIPQITVEMKGFIQRLPELTAQLHATVTPVLEKHLQIEIPRSWNDVFNEIYNQVSKQGDDLFAPASRVTRFIFSTTFMALFVLIATLMFPVFLFFLLKDFPRIIQAVDGLIPREHRHTARRLARDIDLSLSAFLHGQFTVMLVLGTFYAIGYSIVGIPLALVIGLLTGLLCFIPYLGAATGFLLALMMAVFSFSGWTPIIGVLIVFGTVQALDAVLVTPRILGEKLGLQPLWIIVALMAGAEIFGFLGVLLAVPTMAVLKILVGFSVEAYKHSRLYRGDNDTPTIPPTAPPPS